MNNTIDIKIDGKAWTRNVQAPAGILAVWAMYAERLFKLARIPAKIRVRS